LRQKKENLAKGSNIIKTLTKFYDQIFGASVFNALPFLISAREISLFVEITNQNVFLSKKSQKLLRRKFFLLSYNYVSAIGIRLPMLRIEVMA
jgi:hypothetical protein